MEAHDQRDESTTVLDPPASGTKTVAPSLSVQISEQALAAVEAQRMRGLLGGVAVSSAIVTVIVMVLGGDPLAQTVHASALAASAVATGFCALLFRNPKRYSAKVALYMVVGQIIVLLTGYYYWGVFSAYLAIMPLSIYIAAGTASKLETIFGVGACVVAQTSLQLATAFGWIESRGMVEPIPPRATLTTQIVAIVLLQIITIGAALAGRAARRDSAKVLDAHNQALLELAQREAQLAEAYADARAVREAVIGGAGRFTEQTIDGFRLGAVLGRGAMGEIYAATRVVDNVPVAIKILAPHLMREPGARERFVRESQIVSALTSPYVVRVFAVSSPNAPLPYIAMERLQGIDLAQLIKRQPTRTSDELVQLVTHVAAGLDAAHAAGIIHRDLKPSNIYATGTGALRTWKLLDFGASKWSDGEGTLTRDNLVGTPGYMAPEQALGRSVDRRADVYAFGVILYRLLTGVPAVVPGEVPAMLQEVSFRMPIQPSKRAKVPAALEAVLAIALAKQPEKRFATAGELATAFVAAIQGNVDPAITSRAHAVLAEVDWGQWMRR